MLWITFYDPEAIMTYYGKLAQLGQEVRTMPNETLKDRTIRAEIFKKKLIELQMALIEQYGPFYTVDGG